MSNSFADTTTTNMELTPCRVTLGGVDLGGTLDNVTLSIQTEKSNILADQSGSSVRDKVVSGQSLTVTTSLAETNLKENWKVVFPHMKLISSGSKATYLDLQIGDHDLARAQELILHPLSRPDADLTQDHQFYKAVATAQSELVFSPTEQSKLNVVWEILPDDSVVPPRYWFHGDPAVGLVAAIAGTAVADGGNTGDGTVSGETAFSGVTVTETITMTCVTPITNGGVFDVNGSITGPQGLATVGVAFVSPYVSFTLNDGATDFALGDSFTIAMTAANYA